MVRYGKSTRRRTLDVYQEEDIHARLCEWDGCTAGGAYRAPRSRGELNSYQWFCLDHVREYNSKWNFYQGMTENEVEADMRRDTVWQRPTWPFGKATANFAYHRARVRTDFGDFEEEKADDAGGRFSPIDSETRRALMILDLDPPVTASDVKARYKELVKLHHPDANGGDKASEERFKEINAAYQTLRNDLSF
jgi:hypothetical protein